MGSAYLLRLQLIWQRFATMGASDNDLHELVTLAQDMECDRIAAVLEEVAAEVDPRSAGLLRATRDLLHSRGHRPAV